LSPIFASEQAFMLYPPSPIFHRDVFQKPMSHTNNKLNEHGGGGNGDAGSRIFYNLSYLLGKGWGRAGG
jgi:hypothetical protein